MLQEDRSMTMKRSKRTTVVALIIIGILLLPYTISFGDQLSTLTVVNGTAHYIHAIIDSQPFLYIAPNESVKFETESTGNIRVNVQVFYSPGQDISGEATNSFTLGGSRIDDSGGGCGTGGFGSGGGCGPITSRPPVLRASWRVTPEMLNNNR
jgi:hypothetical protein